MISSLMPLAAAIVGLLMALFSVLLTNRTAARWWLFAGMVILSMESLLTGVGVRSRDLSESHHWLTLGLIVKSFASTAWLGFTLTYSRGDSREILTRWRVPLALVALAPIGLSIGFQQQLLEISSAGEEAHLRFGAIGKALNSVLLIGLVWILMNLEHTFRSAVGTMRWRIKFVVLGLVIIFGAHVYVRSQALLFTAYDLSGPRIEWSALLVGCGFLVLAYSRTRLAEANVYPSRALLGSSFTVLFVACYLFVLGIFANIVRRFGGAESFQIATFVLLLGLAGLAALLVSDRFRQRFRSFVARHFARAQHDSVRIWTDLSSRLANVKDQAGLCTVSASLISETFEALSVAVWLLDEHKEQLTIGTSTARTGEVSSGTSTTTASHDVVVGIRSKSSPFNLDEVNKSWAEEFRRLNPTNFSNGGRRWCVPLRAGERSLGALVLADRVNSVDYTVEELNLLQCIVDQITSVLLNLQLADAVTRSRELEAFRTMSAFFVHDLKNAASSLNLMLKNLPLHFDDPEFRTDAVRAIANTARRIDEMIGRLTALRQQPAVRRVEADLNRLVDEALAGLDGTPQVVLTKDLQPLPRILADCDQIRSVVINLVLNAREAVGSQGRIHVVTEHREENVVLSVADNGCGMSDSFLRNCLFRPFQSTKKKGLGIGMFQARTIVEAHGGAIRAESETGKGSTFHVSLPVRDTK